MKYFFAFLCVLSFSLAAHSQKQISPAEINGSVGDSVVVQSKVYGVKHFRNANGSTVLINLGAAFPDQLLTIVVREETIKEMTIEPSEKNLNEKLVTVTGKIELYKGKPQIVIQHPSQLVVAE